MGGGRFIYLWKGGSQAAQMAVPADTVFLVVVHFGGGGVMSV